MTRRPGTSERRALAAAMTRPVMRRAQVASLAAWTAEGAFLTALAVYAYQQGGAAEVGLIGFLRLLPAGVALPFGSLLVDRVPRQRVLVLSSAVRTIALLGVTLGALLGTPSPPVYVGVVLATLAFVVFRPAHVALLPSLCTTPAELTGANATRSLLDGVAALLGPVLAGAALAAQGPGVGFAVATACTAVATWQLVGIRVEVPELETPPPARVTRDLVDGWRALAGDGRIRLLVGIGAAQVAVRGALNVLAVVVVIDLLALDEGAVGLLWAAFGAGALLGASATFRLAGSPRMAVFFGVGMATWGLPLAVVAATSSWLLTLALLAVVGVGNALVDVTAFTLIQRLTPDRVLGRVLGAAEMLWTLAMALGSLGAPLLVDLFGVRGALLALGLALAGLPLLLSPGLRGVDRDVQVRTHEVELLQRVSILRPLPVPVIEQLATRAVPRLVPAGDRVFGQGEAGDDYYVIVDGRARVSVDGEYRRDLGPGDGFGEIALLRPVPRTATVDADTELDLRALSGAAFIRAVGGYRPSAEAADEVIRRWQPPGADPAGG
ncbi:MFS transporter [uncultured Phycicoccus sp.]|uniref:MFS transporter n=1 Tax=uncultured Phycicoccus sp. TaxID=661422 RepID=UPI002618B980|nr:MFS transporter [uncultured Phycicoccus sp.]